MALSESDAKAASKIALWRREPIRFVVEELHAQPDPMQVEVLEAFPHSRRIAMKACKGPGKTTTLSWLAWNFLATRPHPRIAATSISGDNLEDGLWAEMAKWQSRSEFLKAAFEWTKTRISARDHPEDWWMSARTWSRQADPQQQADTLAGLHADYLLFLLDESGGIPDAVIAAAEASLATGIETKLVQAGNPTQLSGALYRACTAERRLWHVIEVTGDPENPKRSTRISLEWAREQIEKYGRDNPWVQVNVFGNFPSTAIDALLGPDEVSAAMKREIAQDVIEFSPRIIGVDVARMGDDACVIARRQGLKIFPTVKHRGVKTHQLAAHVAQTFEDFDADAVFVDDTGGYGAGLVDNLELAGVPVIPINFSSRAIDHSHYGNIRAEMHFKAAEFVKKGGALPNQPEVAAQAAAPKMWFKGGKFWIEEKDQIKVTLGYSPDDWDAIVLTFAQPVRRKKQSSSTQPAGAGSTGPGGWMV